MTVCRPRMARVQRPMRTLRQCNRGLRSTQGADRDDCHWPRPGNDAARTERHCQAARDAVDVRGAVRALPVAWWVAVEQVLEVLAARPIWPAQRDRQQRPEAGYRAVGQGGRWRHRVCRRGLWRESRPAGRRRLGQRRHRLGAALPALTPSGSARRGRLGVGQRAARRRRFLGLGVNLGEQGRMDG